MKRILDNACLSALLCGSLTIATPALAQLGGAGTAGGGSANAGVGHSATTGINGAMTAPSPRPATGAIDRFSAQDTMNSGAGTTRRTVSNAGDSAAAAMNNKVQANAGAGANVSPGVSASGDINSADAANNAASVNRSTQTSAGRMTRQARANADAAEAETTRQLNQQQASINVNGAASKTVQQ